MPPISAPDALSSRRRMPKVSARTECEQPRSAGWRTAPETGRREAT
ncbi:DUF1651 domain-containing protein [Bradyrhizobium japonicum]|nr:DUF1651 domain-containing protein [Bradyrhizobium japonicum]